MRTPGKIAFPVILVLGAITGIMTYTLFNQALPTKGFIESPYRQNITASDVSSGNSSSGGGSATIDESQYKNKVDISILQGAAVQGNPAFDPASSTASLDSLVIWTNNDNVPHSVTSGSAPTDPASGKLFDSSVITAGDSFKIPAKQIGAGEHDYHCSFHPYMKAKITVQ